MTMPDAGNKVGRFTLRLTSDVVIYSSTGWLCAFFLSQLIVIKYINVYSIYLYDIVTNID